ncbi:hypothetical protein OGAPHI_002833 [Ogataea philodendri]|uniref:Uncharacterized protein n=1 Tax=Ogataea philodendri TaxID=1378263 RepID=A0A9P8P9J6_9ASCO|nr:uncharacterized protein OGAPHI_002833 [Ogataea philodendri]KAH3667184.1 hypothetical protein OGAPHI_002833 [Ogataea philodendri]
MATPLSGNLLLSLRPSKIFSNHVPDTPITSLDFDASGQFLVSAGVDESIHLYDVTKGKHMKPIYSKKYGCHLARLARKEKTCVYASTKENDTLRYLSLHDNSFIRYFKGHTAMVTDVEMGDLNHMFLSSSLDNTVKLWDTRTANCQSSLATEQAPNHVALDPTNSTAAIYNTSTNTLSLHAIGNLTDTPFESTVCSYVRPNSVVKVMFMNNNEHILLTTNSTEHYILDAFNLKLVARLLRQLPFIDRKYPDTGNLTVSPDCRFIYGGNGDGSVLVWDMKLLASQDLPTVLNPVKKIENQTKTLPRMLLFNPQYCVMASADTELCLWTPTL